MLEQCLLGNDGNDMHLGNTPSLACAHITSPFKGRSFSSFQNGSLCTFNFSFAFRTVYCHWFPYLLLLVMIEPQSLAVLMLVYTVWKLSFVHFLTEWSRKGSFPVKMVHKGKGVEPGVGAYPYRTLKSFLPELVAAAQGIDKSLSIHWIPQYGYPPDGDFIHRIALSINQFMTSQLTKRHCLTCYVTGNNLTSSERVHFSGQSSFTNEELCHFFVADFNRGILPF